MNNYFKNRIARYLISCLIVLLFINLICVQCINAQETTASGSSAGSKFDFIKKFYNDKAKPFILNTGKEFKELYQGTSKEDVTSFFGFNPSSTRILGDFFIGFFAGILLWIIHYLWELKRFFSQNLKVRDLTDPKHYYRNPKIRWHDFIAREIWKSPIIGLAYALIMQIPILNMVFSWVTLRVLLEGRGFLLGFVLASFILAIEIWFVPAFIERYNMYKVRVKYDKLIRNTKKLQAKVEN